MAVGALLLLCRLHQHEAHTISTATLTERPLACPTLIGLDMCRRMNARDLQGSPGGGVVTVEDGAYQFKCRATKPTYSLGVQVVFDREPIEPCSSTTVRGHQLV